jgi:glycosyltransferase involved in cell wall biosynthesis
MRHLIVCREYPPAPYPPGGIGTYVQHIVRLLAEHGETVHVIGQRWAGAALETEHQCSDRLVIHRIASGDTHLDFPDLPDGPIAGRGLEAMLASSMPTQWFAWRAARLAELLVERAGIDVIEGQEWEAPLYFLLLRRALGLGPGRQPPVITHLHSPTEFIFRHNEWPSERPDYEPMRRLEDYVIGAADAWLCPSRFLASQCEERYELGRGSVTVVPYPNGGTPWVERSPEIWQHGSVCYVGRLELRKGIVEWVRAAVAVAAGHPGVVFDFLGADLPYEGTTSVQQLLERSIPVELRPRFRFHGSLPRAEVLEFLRGAQMAVVPSRWDNLPNTCIEAMASGLPVLVSRHGGMVELVEDGHSGWVAETTEAASDGLAAALRRALATAPADRARMGAAAADAVRRICDDTRVVDQHLVLRRQLVDAGAVRSLAPPPSLPWSAGAVRLPRRRAADAARRGVAVIVRSAGADAGCECVAALERQTLLPTAIVRLDEGSCAAAVEALEREARPLGILFLDPQDRLEPMALAALHEILLRLPEVGLVSCWGPPRWSTAALRTAAPPGFPFHWLADDCASASLYRATALREVGGPRPGLAAGYDLWDLSSAVMASGWVGITYPAVLATRVEAAPREVPAHGGRSRLAMLERFRPLIAADAIEIVTLLEARLAAPDFGGVASPPTLLRRSLELLHKGLRDPRRAVGWIAWQCKDWIRSRLRAVRAVPDQEQP